MRGPSWLALPRALHLRVRSIIGAGMRSKCNRSDSLRRSVRIAKSRVQRSRTPEPSLGWHLRRIVAIVVAFCILGGGLNVAHPASAAEANGAGLMQSLKGFFTKLWDPNASDAEKLGTAYMYDEGGNLISETGTGGANSTGSTQYIYLPTADGPMPIAAVINGQMVAVHSDHLNTPRRLTDANGQAIWQWAYSAFGDEQPSVAANRFAKAETMPNLRTPGITEIVFNLRGRGRYYDKALPVRAGVPMGARIGMWNSPTAGMSMCLPAKTSMICCDENHPHQRAAVLLLSRREALLWLA